MKSDIIDRFKYDKNVFLAVIGKCGGCYFCANACQENAIKERMPPTIDNDLCTRCMECVKACPRGVMQIVH